MSLSKHQSKPRNLGTSGKEAGTKCSEDTREKMTSQQFLSSHPSNPLSTGGPQTQGSLVPPRLVLTHRLFLASSYL